MKACLALAATFATCLMAAETRAASYNITPFSLGSSNYALYVRSENTVFEVLTLTITPRPGVTFANISTGNNLGVPRSPNEDFTFANRRLDGDPLDDPRNKGWSFATRTANANLLDITVGPNPEAPIDTTSEPNGRLFLANISIAGTPTDPRRPSYYADATLELVNNGIAVQTFNIPILDVPEPTGALLAFMAIGAAATRFRRPRRRARQRMPVPNRPRGPIAQRPPTDTTVRMSSNHEQ